MRKVNFTKKRIIISTLIVLFSFTFYVSCKKTPINYQNESANTFFIIPDKTEAIVKQIAFSIQHQNAKEHFLEKLIRKEGYALWDKSDIVTIGDEQRVYVPLVLEKTKYVNSYILYNKKEFPKVWISSGDVHMILTDLLRAPFRMQSLEI
jgi:hypothetical protein